MVGSLFFPKAGQFGQTTHFSNAFWRVHPFHSVFINRKQNNQSHGLALYFLVCGANGGPFIHQILECLTLPHSQSYEGTGRGIKQKRNSPFWVRAMPAGPDPTQLSLKFRRTDTRNWKGHLLAPCSSQGKVATPHQDMMTLKQVWHPPRFPSDTSPWQGHVVLETKNGIYPAGHKQSSFSNEIQEGTGPWFQSQEWFQKSTHFLAHWSQSVHEGSNLTKNLSLWGYGIVRDTWPRLLPFCLLIPVHDNSQQLSWRTWWNPKCSSQKMQACDPNGIWSVISGIPGSFRWFTDYRLKD